MAFRKKTFAPAAVANARRLYEQTPAPLDDIADLLGITGRTLASRIIEWGWTPHKAARPTRSASRKGKRAAPGTKKKGIKPFDLKPEKATTEKAATKRTAPEKTRPTRNHPEEENLEEQSRQATGAAALAVRVQRVVARELDAIDQILGAIGAADAAEAERSARTLASLARALKEVMRLAAPDEPADADDDPVPRDLDEFRRELARRIEALAGGGAAETSGDGG